MIDTIDEIFITHTLSQLYGGEFRGKRMMTDDDLRAIIYEGELEV